MKATRINMDQHTVSVKMNREELAEIHSALAYLSWHYRDINCDNLANQVWELREKLDYAFDRLYGDVE